MALETSCPDFARVIVGREHKEFLVNKTILGDTIPFFRHQLEDEPSRPTEPTESRHSRPGWPANHNSLPIIFLPGESPAMFDLFKIWLHQRADFRRHLDDIIDLAPNAPEAAVRRFHWALVHLHIFAAQHELQHLQDVSIDAIQDLYLRCDWDVYPGFIVFLFGERDAATTIRLRRWATAMVAWTMAGGPSQFRQQGDLAQFDELMQQYDDFNAEYQLHVAKLKQGRLNARIKNPQLRIPANTLRNEERQFGFRQCSFHTHRAFVGERSCPHARASEKQDGCRRPLVPTIVDVRPSKPRVVRHGRYPSCLEAQIVNPVRLVKHAKSPSCPVNQLRQFEFPVFAPPPLRSTREDL